MLSGDLATTPLSAALVQLAHRAATGCLHVVDADGAEARVHLHGGSVYSALLPARPAGAAAQDGVRLGARLVSSGALAPAALADALEAQRTERPDWPLAELLVHLGHVDRAVVDAFRQEQLLAATCDLTTWAAGSWRFQPGGRTHDDVAPPVDVPTLLAAVAHRAATWTAMTSVVGGPGSVPALAAAGGGAPETVLSTDAWSLLCKVDGVRSVAELGEDCGFTLYEAVQTVYELVTAGLAEALDPPLGAAPSEPTAGSFVPAALTGRLVAALGHDPAGDDAAHLPTGRTRAEEPVAAVVDLDAARREAQRIEGERAEAERAEAEHARVQAEAERAAAEEHARARAEAERAAAAEHARAQAEAERAAAAEHARAQAEAERAAAEEHARAQAEAERAAAEEHARAQAEEEHRQVQRLEAERAETERAVAAEHARVASAELAAFGAHSRIDPADAALAFAELRATAASPSVPVPEPALAQEAEPVVAHAAPLPPWEQPAPSVAPDTDTAALLRELTSLGVDDTSNPPSAGPATRTLQVATGNKKRKGLFGRN